MQEFLLSLIAGRREIPRRFAPLYEQLKACGAIERDKHIYKLHSAFKLARVLKVQSAESTKRGRRSGAILACDLGDKSARPMRVGGRVLGLAQGDIILLLIRSKTPRLIKILTQSRSRLVCLVKKRGRIIGIDCQSLESIPLPFSQKSLLELPKYCVLEFTQGGAANGVSGSGASISRILGSLLDPMIDERLILAKHKRDEHFSQECLDLAQSYGSDLSYLQLSQQGLGAGGKDSSTGSGDSASDGGRRDLRALPFITIDPSDAKDHDDAIYWDRESSTLYVAIADVSEYVAPSTALDHAARERCFSLYFPHICYPMLPNALSQNLCSLRANEPKLALVWEIALDRRTHEVLESHLYEALITPSANISYEQASEIISLALKPPKSAPPKSPKRAKLPKPQPCPQDKSLNSLAWLGEFAQIAQALKAKRLESGFDFFTKDITLRLDSQGELESIHESSPSPSHALVEEAMLLANVLSARALGAFMPESRQNLSHDSTPKASHQAMCSGIYRTHEPPTQEKIYTLFAALKAAGYTIPSGDFHSQVCDLQRQANERAKESQRDLEMGDSRAQLDVQIIRAQKEARYSAKLEGHFGLGFGAYTHFTSPIRRYSDLLAHRMLKTLMRDFPARTISLSASDLAKEQGALESKKSKHPQLSPKTLKLLAYLLESTSAMIPLLNDKERDIAKAEAEFRDRKYARFALRLLESSADEVPSQADVALRVRIIDERYPALGVIESRAESRAQDSKAESKTKSKAKSKSKLDSGSSVERFGLFGARVVIEHTECELEQGEVYQAQLSWVDLIAARIYAQILA